MALTDLKKTLAFDANKEAKAHVNSLTNMVGQNGLCVPIAASYLGLVKVVNAMVVPVGHFKGQIIKSLDNEDVLDTLATASEVMDIVGSGIGRANFQIDSSTIQAMNIFNKICLDFNDILPSAMKNFLDDMIDSSNDMFELPSEITDAIGSALSFFNSKILSDCFGDVINDVLSPINAYRDFMNDTGVMPLIKRLQKYEKCMTNPNTCNRPKTDFYFPGTKKYNSQYYLELLAVNLKGEVQLKRLDTSFERLEGSMYKTLKKADAFTKSPIKL